MRRARGVVLALAALTAIASLPALSRAVIRRKHLREAYACAVDAERRERWSDARHFWQSCVTYRDAGSRLAALERRLAKHKALMHSGNTSLALGRLEEADARFRSAQSLAPSPETTAARNVVAQRVAARELAKGRASIRAYRLVEAQRHFEVAHSCLPSDETRRAMAALAKLKADDASRFLAGAERLIRQGRLAEADGPLRKVAALSPDADQQVQDMKRRLTTEWLAKADALLRRRRARAAVVLLQRALRLQPGLAPNVDQRLTRIGPRDYPGAFGSDGNWLIDRVMPVEEALNRAVQMEFSGHPEPRQENFGTDQEWIRAADGTDDACLRRVAQRFHLSQKLVFEAHSKVVAIEQRAQAERRRAEGR